MAFRLDARACLTSRFSKQSSCTRLAALGGPGGQHLGPITKLDLRRPPAGWRSDARPARTGSQKGEPLASWIRYPRGQFGITHPSTKFGAVGDIAPIADSMQDHEFQIATG